MNLYQKIVEIKKSLNGFSKDTKGYGYYYVSGSQILRAVKEKMDELGVLLVPEVDYDTMQWEKHEYITNKNKEALDFIVTMKMNYTWINAENPEETLKVPWVCMGQQQDDISKAVGTAMTYNERYFLLKFLGLPTDEDDADNKEPVNASNSYSKPQQNATNANTKNNDKKLSEAQCKRLYGIAYGKGVKREQVKEAVLKQLGKDIADMTKTEYDMVCKSYENM